MRQRSDSLKANLCPAIALADSFDRYYRLSVFCTIFLTLVMTLLLTFYSLCIKQPALAGSREFSSVMLRMPSPYRLADVSSVPCQEIGWEERL